MSSPGRDSRCTTALGGLCDRRWTPSATALDRCRCRSVSPWTAALTFDAPNFAVLTCCINSKFRILPSRGPSLTLTRQPLGKAYLYSAFRETSTRGAQVWITQGCPCKLHHTCLYLANVHQMAPPERQTSASVRYSFIDPGRMKG